MMKSLTSGTDQVKSVISYSHHACKLCKTVIPFLLIFGTFIKPCPHRDISEVVHLEIWRVLVAV